MVIEWLRKSFRFSQLKETVELFEHITTINNYKNKGIRDNKAS